MIWSASLILENYDLKWLRQYRMGLTPMYQCLIKCCIFLFYFFLKSQSLFLSKNFCFDLFLNALNFKAITPQFGLSRACLGTWLHCMLQLNVMCHCSQTHCFALYIQSTLSLDLILNVVWHTSVCIYILQVWPCILGKVMKSLLDGWFMQFDINWGKTCL